MENLNVTMPKNIDNYIEGYEEDQVYFYDIISMISDDLNYIKNFYEFYIKNDETNINKLKTELKKFQDLLKNKSIIRTIETDEEYLKLFFLEEKNLSDFQEDEKEIRILINHSIFIKRNMKEISHYEEKMISKVTYDWDYEEYDPIYIHDIVNLNYFKSNNGTLEHMQSRLNNDEKEVYKDKIYSKGSKI